MNRRKGERFRDAENKAVPERSDKKHIRCIFYRLFAYAVKDRICKYGAGGICGINGRLYEAYGKRGSHNVCGKTKETVTPLKKPCFRNESRTVQQKGIEVPGGV